MLMKCLLKNQKMLIVLSLISFISASTDNSVMNYPTIIIQPRIFRSQDVF